MIRTLDDLLKMLEGEDAFPDASSDHICFCGTKRDAFDTALKLMGQMVENDCTLWAIQVAQAMSQISVALSIATTGDHEMAMRIARHLAEIAAEPEPTSHIKALMRKAMEA